MVNDNGPRVDLLKIEAYHCWRCGILFDETEQGFKDRKNKTMHEAIPRFLKPKRNVSVPICRKCHEEMNLFNSQSLPKLDAVDNLVENLKKAIVKYEEISKKYKIKEEGTNEGQTNNA